MIGRTVTAVVIAGAISALGTIGAGEASVPHAPPASPLPTRTWTTDAQVSAVATAGNRIYLGGSFSRIGPVTGGGVQLDETTAAYDARFPFVLGRVYAAVDDGQGGVFIGGKFTQVGGLPRANIAHVLGDGSVDANFVPGVDDTVRALALDGTRLYVGGDFLHANDLIRRRLAAFDTTNGFVDHGFDPGVDGPVTDLALAPGRLFVAGLYLGISGNARTTLAAVDPQTGDLDHSFDAAPDGAVVALQVIGDRLFAGGGFHTVNGRSRSELAAFDVQTGELISDFSPSVNGPVVDLTTDGTHLFVGGRFTEIGRSFNTSLASLDPQTGKASQDFRAFVDGDVRSMSFADGKLFIAGAFLKVDGQAVDRLASVDATTGAVDLGFRPDPDNDVLTVVAGGGRVYAGGTFTSAPRFLVSGVAALDATTGVWDPSFSAVLAAAGRQAPTVSELAAHGDRLYAAGSFDVADGQPRKNIAAFDLGTGALSPFNANTDGSVNTMSFGSGRLFIGGSFGHVRKQFHNSLAAVDPQSGKPVRNFNRTFSDDPGPFREVYAVHAAAGRLFVGGFIVTGHKIVKKRKVDITASLVSASPLRGVLKRSFKSKVDGDVTALAGARRLYVAGYVSRISGFRTKIVHRHGKPKKVRVPKFRRYLFALDPRSGKLNLRFHPNASSINALAVGARGLYVAGGYRVAAGRNRRDGVALLNPSTGVPLADFHPEPRTGSNDFASVSSIALGTGRVVLGGAFKWIGASYQPWVALLPVASV